MDDDYVAQVLAAEARDSSEKYSSQGPVAYMPRKPTSGAPKPNTRFLRHLIKETSNHNTALKRKEEREARERQRQLKELTTSASGSSSHASRRRERESGDHRSSRDHGRDHTDRHRSHRSRRHRTRSSSAEMERSRRPRRHENHNSDEDLGDREERRRARHGHTSSRHDRREREEGRRRRRERSYSRSRSRSPRRDRSPTRHRSRRHDRSKSPSHTHSRSYELHRSQRSKRDEDTTSLKSRPSRSETATRQEKASSAMENPRETDTEHDSDPLEDLVGPLPPYKHGQSEAPLRSRGRGAYKPKTSNMDAHFAPDYDPALDVQPDDDPSPKHPTRRPVAGLMTADDDWDMALEALRDRTRWKQKGEERLRAAGVNEDTIQRWKDNPAFTGVPGDGAGRSEDVKWSKKGEGREWDRGKFVDEDGHIDIRAQW
ncbi:uncharacterized protein PFLUO_LOCUS214 [Penicillium psychrofluorescens]|uniref:uncharacterized protein n=1 Tax=Penicillium psychrofluorescens TaxID=3158075 RepID=UPI003CCCFB65